MRTTFLTSRAAGRHMVRQGSGDPPRDYYRGGLQVAFEAIEAMRRQLSPSSGATASGS